jgi:hypothetical protein
VFCLEVVFGECVLQVVRCCLEHAASVAKVFLTSDVVVTEIKEEQPAVAGNPMDASGMDKLVELGMLVVCRFGSGCGLSIFNFFHGFVLTPKR